MFFEYLDRLRRLSDYRKRFIAFGSATVVTAVIFAVWLSSIFSLASGSGATTADATGGSGDATMQVAAATTPFASIIEAFTTTIDQIKRQIAAFPEMGTIKVDNTNQTNLVVVPDASSTPPEAGNTPSNFLQINP